MLFRSQAIAYGGGQLTESVVRNMLGSVDRGHVRALLQALAARDGAALLGAVDGLRSLGLSAAGTLEEMALLLQQMAVAQAVPGALDAQDPNTEDARALADFLPADETQLLYSMALHGREELSLMSDEYAALAMVLLRFLAFPSQARTAAAVRPAEPAREGVREAVRAAPLRAPAPPTITLPRAPVTLPVSPSLSPPAASTAPAAKTWAPPPAAAPALFVAETAIADFAVAATVATSVLGDRWQALVQQMCDQATVSALARELALQGGLCAIDESRTPPLWQLVVERETLRAPALRDKLAAAIGAAVGHAVNIELLAGTPDDTPARRDAAERARRQAAAEAAIHGDPVVRDLLSQFKTARIVPGSIKPV